MSKALTVLACGAFLTLLFEATGAADPLGAVVLAATFTALAVFGFAWVHRQSGSRARVLAAGYVLVQLLLGFVIFSVTAGGFGATLLLMVLVAQSVLLLPLAAAAVVTLAVPLVHVGMAPFEQWRNILGTLAAAVFTAVVTELVQREQLARARLAAANAALQEYADQAEQMATIQERNRLARDIHDGLGHHLTVVQMQLQAGRALLHTDPERADTLLSKAQQQTAEALAEVRRSVATLRDSASGLTLQDRLTQLAELSSSAGLPTVARVDGAARPVPASTEDAIFRAAQEGLTNARKHAAASTARVTLDYRRPDRVSVEIVDDGGGLVPGSADSGGGSAGFGIVGLRERAAQVGGQLSVRSGPEQGTTLRLEVPG